MHTTWVWMALIHSELSAEKSKPRSALQLGGSLKLCFWLYEVLLRVVL